MAIQEKTIEILREKMEALFQKTKEVTKNYINKQLEIIKNVDSTFVGSVEDFFDAHTVASCAIYYDADKKYFDEQAKKFVDYDEVQGGLGLPIGKVYDSVGKQVLASCKKTREYRIYEVYSRLLGVLFDVIMRFESAKEKKNVTMPDQDFLSTAYTTEFLADTDLNFDIKDFDDLTEEPENPGIPKL